MVRALTRTGRHDSRQVGVSGGVRIWQSASSLFAFLRHGPVLRLVYTSKYSSRKACVAPPVAQFFFLVRGSSRESWGWGARGVARISASACCIGATLPGLSGMLNNITAGGSVHGISGKYRMHLSHKSCIRVVVRRENCEIVIPSIQIIFSTRCSSADGQLWTR